ncbi:MAG: hypothetical protein V4668_02775 [Patescibacteria group bacterium]
MKYILIIVATVVGLGVLFFAFNTFIYNEKQGDEMEAPADVQTETYTLPEEGLTFVYPAGNDGYTVLEMPDTLSEPMPVRTLRLLPTSDYQDEQSRVGGEGSPSWMLSIYANDQKLQPAQWVEANAQVSNIPLALGQPVEAIVGGANAVTYRIDGLYPTQVYVIAQANLIYVAQVSFMDETARTYTEHEAWINSFEFTPIKPVQMAGKLNPQIVCEGALAYMTFESSEASDSFVADCMEGKHPEVFEKYISDRGLDGAAI